MAHPTLNEQLDTLYTTTWEHRKAKAHDNIFTATPFWFWMKEKGKFRTEIGGRFIMEPLEYAKNESIEWITKGQAVSLEDFEFLTESKWDWRYLTGSIVRFGIDDQQNRGRAQIIKLMTRKMDNLDNSMIDTLETALFAAQSGNSIEGLQNLVPDTGVSSSDDAGGIPPATYTWFANKQTSATGRSFAVYGFGDMRSLLNECSQSRQLDRPDIIICGQTPYEYYEDETMEQKQIVNKKLGDAGFTNVEFKGIPMVYSPACSDARMYFLNTNFLYFTYDPGMNFDLTEWKPIPDQVNDRAAQTILACALMVTRRLCQGVYHTIDTA
jgi:hypothetical protein